MLYVRSVVRVLAVLVGLVLLPISSTPLRDAGPSMCASEADECRPELDTICMATGIPQTDMKWVTKP